jgi:putative membrane protein
MVKDPLYAKIQKEHLILRDYLATERTIFANERTYLAYIRTALALFIAGISVVQLAHFMIFKIFGGFLAASGLLVFMIGSIKFRHTKELILEVKRDTDIIPEHYPKDKDFITKEI